MRGILIKITIDLPYILLVNIYLPFPETEPPRPVGTAEECGDSMEVCQEVIGLWSVGVDGNCVHEEMGFLIGGTEGFRYAVMEV